MLEKSGNETTTSIPHMQGVSWAKLITTQTLTL